MNEDPLQPGIKQRPIMSVNLEQENFRPGQILSGKEAILMPDHDSTSYFKKLLVSEFQFECVFVYVFNIRSGISRVRE